ncbi:MAG: ShlB/FhaC/HecB family hemolysin secretion/activation protein [Rhodocyclaceae bacterium]|nr:ShlB/FhaC/HecB family hemolysin secretion/activation protein [Rhodocyclaceae bacterium]MDZ4214626.1 ShlB/FhaC/HecB family hemolysin secretion/activation protein [Rhodocyclaceae bacterium]
MFLHRAAWLAALSLVAATGVSAQTSPDAGQLLRESQPLRPALPDRLPASEAPPTRPDLQATGGEKIAVHRIRFTGHEGLTTAQELHALVADAIGQSLDLGQLRQLADRVTRHLKSRGWFLARAYLPAQDVTEGDIEIAILPGRLEGGLPGAGIVVAGESLRIDAQRIRTTVAGALQAAGAEGAVHDSHLERGLLLVNDLPGVTARSTLEKGADPGTTRLVIQAQEGPLLSGNIGIDNQGNRYTGAERANGQLALNNPLRIGDQATLAFSAATGLELASLGYSLPLGHDGWRLSVGHTRLSYRIGEELAANRSRGEAATSTLGLGYPLLRSRQKNISLRFALEHKALRDESLGVVVKDRRIHLASVGMNFDSLDTHWGGGMNNAALTLHGGDADYSRVAADLTADAPAGTAGSFQRLNFNLARLQKLSTQTALFAALSGQQAAQNLPSSEKFGLGGPAAVRAYPGGEASGDSGLLGTVELRHDLPAGKGSGQWQFVGFVDAGQIALNKNPWPGSTGNATGRNRYTLAGAGLGINYSEPGQYVLRAVWAHKLGDNPGRAAVTHRDADGRRDSNRFWLTAMLFF